jgi:hypothetical protein
MKTSNFILLLFVFNILISCSEDKNDLEYNLPYFQFKNEDKPNLLNLPELNARLTFVNQNNEELYFDVVKSESGIQLHSTGSWVSNHSTKYFYFDEQRIHLRTTLFDVKNFERDIEITASRRPKEFNDGRNGKPKIISDESNLITFVGYYGPFNNKDQGALIEYENLINISSNNSIFTRVFKIDLTKTEIRDLDWPLPSLDYMFFDINEGIIGFDDRNGNEWRLKS